MIYTYGCALKLKRVRKISRVVTTNVSLEALNTLAIPARAAHFAELTDLAQLPLLLQFARESDLNVFILGEGSNCVFASDYSGLVIQQRLQGIDVQSECSERVLVKVAAGENWHAFVQWCLANNFHGLENLALIPGTVGAAPIQNIGAYGVEVETFIERVHAIEIDSGKAVQFSHAQCQFAYRESVFKRALRDRVVITHVEFSLLKHFLAVSHYPSLSQQLTQPVTAQSLFDAVCTVRRSKLPDPIEIPNAGSFFKNPVISSDQLIELQRSFPSVVSYPVESEFKVAAGWLIDQAGWKQKQLDCVIVHHDQALVVTNPKHRPGASVLQYAYNIQSDIKRRFGIDLEIEPRVIF